MNRLFILVAGLALAGAAAAAPQPAPGTYYYWLHPKLGMVKVDRATHFMIVSGRTAR